MVQEITDIKTLVDGSLVMTFGTRCDYCTVISVPKYGVMEVGYVSRTYRLSLCDCFKDTIFLCVVDECLPFIGIAYWKNQ